jgi:tripartite-type tricarboxylate transporter receptor subunit TctC
MMKAAPYESLGELAPVSIVGRLTFAMFTHPGVPAKNLAEFIAHARVNPDKLAYASATASEHMAAAQLMKATGISMVRVPYKGGAQALPDLLAGRVQVYFTPISPGLPHVKEGKLRLIATLLPQRTPVAPDAPTIAEAGMAGVSVPTWQAIFAPPKTPREITDRLARDIAQAMKDPDLRAQFERLAILPEGSTPEVLAAAIRDEQKVWAQFVRDNGIVPE